jgi:hypothetical protein
VLRGGELERAPLEVNRARQHVDFAVDLAEAEVAAARSVVTSNRVLPRSDAVCSAEARAPSMGAARGLKDRLRSSPQHWSEVVLNRREIG